IAAVDLPRGALAALRGRDEDRRDRRRLGCAAFHSEDAVAARARTDAARSGDARRGGALGMSEHDAIRELLPLAAAAALEERERRQIDAHLRTCADCSAELDRYRALGFGLRRLPTPQAPPLLVERTRQQIQLQLAAAAERAMNPWLLGFLVL